MTQPDISTAAIEERCQHLDFCAVDGKSPVAAAMRALAADRDALSEALTAEKMANAQGFSAAYEAGEADTNRQVNSLGYVNVYRNEDGDIELGSTDLDATLDGKVWAADLGCKYLGKGSVSIVPGTESFDPDTLQPSPPAQTGLLHFAKYADGWAASTPFGLYWIKQELADGRWTLSAFAGLKTYHQDKELAEKAAEDDYIRRLYIALPSAKASDAAATALLADSGAILVGHEAMAEADVEDAPGGKPDYDDLLTAALTAIQANCA